MNNYSAYQYSVIQYAHKPYQKRSRAVPYPVPGGFFVPTGGTMSKTLREHRIERLWTIRDLATAAGIAVTTIMATESGTRRAHFGTMLAVASALGVGVREIQEFDAALSEKIAA